ncbi:hypothetical protein [Nocardia brasiliensis]|uniref:hypothetical protein n=1 Tax=Nocardia brasiliensis TaxID=37326 RepID=UPI0024543EFD|nr:hypothetical protein [Nocardia brasiliensis]
MTMVAAALAAGSAAGLTSTAERAVGEAYQALKGLVASRYRSVDVAALEQQPESTARRAALAEELAQAGASDDADLHAEAGRLLLVVQQRAPQVAAAVGVRLREVRADELEITDITADDSGVIAENITVTGSFTISGVQAGGRSAHPPTAQQG